jgi:Sugar (and other) transporter
MNVHRIACISLFLACALQAAQQLSRFNYAMHFAAKIFTYGWLPNQLVNDALLYCRFSYQIPFAFIALTSSDKVGRRRIPINQHGRQAYRLMGVD